MLGLKPAEQGDKIEFNKPIEKTDWPAVEGMLGEIDWAAIRFAHDGEPDDYMIGLVNAATMTPICFGGPISSQDREIRNIKQMSPQARPIFSARVLLSLAPRFFLTIKTQADVIAQNFRTIEDQKKTIAIKDGTINTQKATISNQANTIADQNERIEKLLTQLKNLVK